MSAPVAVLAVDGGDLALGGGLLAIARPALDLLEAGGVLAILSSARSLRDDLPSWCRVERHEYLDREVMPDGRDRHLLRRGALGVPRAATTSGTPLKVREGHLRAADLLAASPMPAVADPHTGFAPRGSRVEPGGPAYPFTLCEQAHLAPPEIGALYDQAVGAQWDPTTAIPWHTVRPLPPALERAIGQVMGFLAENELSALYVPALFLPRIHPAYTEVAQLLATQMADEARHIDVFLKRARIAGGAPGVSAVTTARSLLSLMETADFTEATFLLSVLGEGTFLDLLRFIEDHAPDEATAELTRRARHDESRHVHFGLAHVRHALGHDEGLYARLEGAVRRRAASLHGAGGVPHALQDALVVLAAGGDDPRAVAKGHEAFRELLDAMDQGRRRRLEHAGFTADQASTLSDLHTPNFM